MQANETTGEASQVDDDCRELYPHPAAKAITDRPHVRLGLWRLELDLAKG